MKAILIDPFDQTISEVEVTNIAKTLQCDYWEPIFIGRNTNLCVDEEALLKPGRVFFRWTTYPRPILGRALVSSYNSDGDEIDVLWNLEAVTDHVVF